MLSLPFGPEAPAPRLQLDGVDPPDLLKLFLYADFRPPSSDSLTAIHINYLLTRQDPHFYAAVFHPIQRFFESASGTSSSNILIRFADLCRA
jgi:hypothetical protein